MHIRAMTPTDAPDVLKIYQDGIDTGNATFETTAPTWETFDHTHLPDHRLIAHDDTGPLGWIAATPTSTRHVYRGVIEHSIYIATHAQGRGVGSALLAAFVDSCETAGIWTIQAGIFPDNTPSLALHEKHGFRIIGIRHHIGQTIDGRWRDVALLERRSTTIGV
ncbi:GCN5-related N-acetyltransferase [Stackebrandtia nassauensis DSM 44728]|uniref:GCN5-related N-acetyltransferase n=2 Tax=Stackebrandtia TaxID=283810 RepID=D3QBH8_STANL|nr:GCN5-related N-acetyltransferase [Stackebrandtia nassauensis DSM 44728]